MNNNDDQLNILAVETNHTYIWEEEGFKDESFDGKLKVDSE